MSKRLRLTELSSRQKFKKIAILGASVSFAYSFNTPAQAQDWKPGDPIPFGTAHKSMFDTSTPAGLPGSSRVIPPGTVFGASSSGAASASMNPATSAAASAPPNAMDNFLNSRSIEWKPGDPVSFGAAHHPAANGKSINGDNNQSPTAIVPLTPISTPVATPGGLQGFPPSPSPVLGVANSPMQDLAPAPSSFAPGAGVGAGTVPAIPTNIPKWAPVSQVAPGASSYAPGGVTTLPTGSNGKKNKANKSDGKKNSTNQQTDPQQQQKSKSSASSGNIFSHAFHWMFGGN